MHTVLEVDVTLLAFLIGSVMPLLTGMVTKISASSRVKSVTNLVLSVLAGVLAHLMENTGKSTLLDLATAAITAYLAAGVTYQNLWKPAGTTAAVQNKTAGTGIG